MEERFALMLAETRKIGDWIYTKSAERGEEFLLNPPSQFAFHAIPEGPLDSQEQHCILISKLQQEDRGK